MDSRWRNTIFYFILVFHLESRWNPCFHVEYVESTWNLWGRVKYTFFCAIFFLGLFYLCYELQILLLINTKFVILDNLSFYIRNIFITIINSNNCVKFICMFVLLGFCSFCHIIECQQCQAESKYITVTL